MNSRLIPALTSVQLSRAERDELHRLVRSLPGSAQHDTVALRELRDFFQRLERQGSVPPWIFAAHVRLRYGGECVTDAIEALRRELMAA